MHKLLITGATGFMGSHFVYYALVTSPDMITCIVRPQKNKSASERLLEAVMTAANDWGGDNEHLDIVRAAFALRVRVVEGDIAQPGLNLDGVEVDVIWHFAARLAFADKLRQQLHDAIAVGTDALIEYAKQRKVREFNYISTAYVSGCKRGLILEQAVDCEFDPQNPYEEYKRVAESKVACLLATGINYRIFRPSVVIGHSKTGLGDSNAGYYGILNLSCRLKYDIDDKIIGYFDNNQLSLVCDDADPEINLVNIDLAIQMMQVIAANEESVNQYFHIASPESVSFDCIIHAIRKTIGVRYETKHNADDLNPIDYLIYLQSSDFRPYFSSGLRFSLNNTLKYSGVRASTLVVDDAVLLNVTTHFVSKYTDQYQKKNAQTASIIKRMHKKVVETDMGPLNYYTGGEGEETIVIVNAYGQSLYFWSPLLTELFDRYRFIIWEQRGLSGIDGGMLKFFSVDHHVDDVRAIIAVEDVQACYIMGWCTGPKLVIEVYQHVRERVKGLIFLTGMFKNLESHRHQETPYEINLEPLCQLVDRNPELASSLKESLKAILAGRQVNLSVDGPCNQAQENVSNVLSLISAKLRPLVIAPFLNENSIINYARQMLGFWDRDIMRILPDIDVPTLFICGEEDQVSSTPIAHEIAKRIKNSVVALVKLGSHYVHYENPTLIAAMLREFISNNNVDQFVDPTLSVYRMDGIANTQPSCMESVRSGPSELMSTP